MRKFDADGRTSDEFAGWLEAGNQKYAVAHEGKLYPPKLILSWASGISRSRFNGGTQTNAVLNKLGFRTIRLEQGSTRQRPSALSVRHRAARQLDRILLYQLAYACRLYAGLTGFDKGYNAFQRATNGHINFANSEHLKALLVWLNSWGCRQFSLNHHDAAAQAISEWAATWETRLPIRNKPSQELADAEIKALQQAYAELYRRQASARSRSSGQYVVTIGPTGAAKILFAGWPYAVAPCDAAIRTALGYSASADDFERYLLAIRYQISAICEEASSLGITCEGLPQAIGREGSTLPKLIDEYNWVVYTRGMTIPDPEELARLHSWSQPRLG